MDDETETMIPNQDDDLVFRRVCEIMAPFNKNRIKLERSTDITCDLEIDSVAVLDLIMEVEDGYDVSFPMNLISEVRTIGDLVDAIHQLKRG